MIGIGDISGDATNVSGKLSAIASAGITTFILCIMSIFGLITHFFTGHIDWFSGMGFMLGAMTGSGITPFISNKLDSTKVNKYLTPLLTFFAYKCYFSQQKYQLLAIIFVYEEFLHKIKARYRNEQYNFSCRIENKMQ